MKLKALSGIMLTLLLIGMLTLAFNILQVKAEVATLAAPVIVETALTPWSTFSVDITVDDVEKLWGVEFILWYDTRVLTAIDYGLYPPFTGWSPSEMNDPEGYVAMAFYTYMGDSEGLTTVDPVPICWIEFIVDNFGKSLLHFDDPPHTELAAVGGIDLPFHAVDGFFQNVPPVGGVATPVDKFGLLAPYIGLASTIAVATVATAIYIKRREEKR